MKKIINETFIINRVKKHLSPCWQVVVEKDLHERGCDLVLKDTCNKHKARRFLIECKGKSYARFSRAVNETVWLYALGQLVTRMRVIARHAYKYGLGLPEISAKELYGEFLGRLLNSCVYIFFLLMIKEMLKNIRQRILKKSKNTKNEAA